MSCASHWSLAGMQNSPVKHFVNIEHLDEMLYKKLPLQKTNCNCEISDYCYICGLHLDLSN